MKHLAKFLLCVKTDHFVFSKKDVNFIIGLTSTQIKDLKKYALENDLIIYSKHQYNLTDKGVELLNKTPADSWRNDINYPKRPKINLEYLKEEKAPATLTRAIRLLTAHVLDDEELTPNSMASYLLNEIFSQTNCNELKEELKKDLLNTNKYSIKTLFDKYADKPYGLTKSIFSLLLLCVLNENKNSIAIYEKGQFQIKIDSLLFERMLYLSQNFELQYVVLPDNSAFEKVSELLLNTKTCNALDITKALILYIKKQHKYTLSTNNISTTASKFRDAIINSKDPLRLLYNDIPKILSANDFIDDFKKVLQELQNCYSNLTEELKKFLLDNFKETNIENLKARFNNVEEFINDKELKILSRNIREDSSDQTLWIERIATFINKYRVPKDWNDLDVADFKLKIKELAVKFLLIEATSVKIIVVKDKVVEDVLNKVKNLSKLQLITVLREVLNG